MQDVVDELLAPKAPKPRTAAPGDVVDELLGPKAAPAEALSAPTQDEPSLLSRVATGVKDAFVGNSVFDFQEIGEFARDNQGERFVSRRFGGTPERANARRTPRERQFHALAQKLFLPTQNERIEDLVKAEFPEAIFKSDPNGNPFVQLPEGNFYLNASGFSGQDTGRAFTEASLAATGSSLTARAIPAGIGPILTRAGGGVVGGFGASTATDALAGEDVDINKAVVTAGIAGSLEVLLPGLARLGRGSFNKLGAIFRKPGVLDDGTVTAAGRRELEAIGINPDEVSPETVRTFLDLTRTTDDAQAAFRQAQAQTLPEPVTLQSGQATQDPVQRTFETQGAKGAFGEETAGRLTSSLDDQQAALRQNVDEIANDIAGQETTPTQGGANAQEELLRQNQSLRNEISGAFNSARAQRVFVPADEVPKLGRDIKRALDGFDVEGLPRIKSLIDNLDGLVPSERVSKVTIRSLEGFRRRVSKAARLSDDAETKQAARTILQTYDTVLETRLKDALLTGSDDAIKAWKNARSLRKEYGRIFEADDIVKTLVAKTKDGTNRLIVDSHEAANYIFGRGAIGAKRGLLRDVIKLRDTLGRDSQAWNGIRAEGFLRFFRNDTGDGLFKAAQFSKEWAKAQKEADPVLRAMFSQRERNLISQLSDVAQNINAKKAIAGDANPSGTAATRSIINKFRGEFGALGDLAGGLVERFLGGIRRANSRLGADDASRGVLPPRETLVPTGTGSGLAALADQSRSSSQERDQ